MNEKEKDFNITGTDIKSIDEINCKKDLSSENIISEFEENNNDEKDFITFDTREPKELEFVWYPLIVKGNLNIIEGVGGTGKSFLTTWLLSAISTGAKMPFSDKYFKQGNSILQNAEDDIDGTIIPRLIANGADRRCIGYINEEIKAFNVKQLLRLERQIIKFKPEIVIIDPLTSYLGGVNMYVANEVRDVLKPLKELAQKYNCAIVFIMHLNKNSGTSATNRTLGSVDFVSIARSVLLVTEDPQDKTKRLLIPVKTNLMKESEKRALCYKINDNGSLEWVEDRGYINADDILNQEESSFNKDSIARGFILGALSQGDLTATELKSLVLEKGNISLKAYNITKATLRKEDKIDYYQKDKKYFWTLKEKEKGDVKNDI